MGGRPIESLVGQTFGVMVVTKFLRREGRNTYWELQCACGNIDERHTESLMATRKRGALTSCGCKDGEAKKKQYTEEGLLLTLRDKPYERYKVMASQRKISFKLTKEQVRTLITQNCHYCDTPPNNHYTQAYSQFPENMITYQGIDRLDSSKGYVKENVVSCCKECNIAKNDYSPEFFLAHVQNIHKHMNL